MNDSGAIYLDGETNWQRELTVVGIYGSSIGLIQLVGEQIDSEALEAVLPTQGKLYTFNGHSFDLPVVRKQLGLALRQRFDSIDLMHVCRKRGLRGGQKLVEKQLGFRRVLPDMDGRDAIVLWERYLRGDTRALSTLLQYNGEDIAGMMRIKKHLDQTSVPAREASQ